MSMLHKEKNHDFPGKAGNEFPFSVPEGYFDRFPERLLNRMKQQEQRSWMGRTYQLIRPQLAVAAIIIGIIAISYTGIRIILNEKTAEPSVIEIADVINDFLYDMDDELLITTLVEEDIEVGWINGGYESEDIMDYLMDEETDYTNLINEYNIY
jgi:hypothetical protein